MAENEKSPYVFKKSLQTPAHISSLAFGHTVHLFAGSDDGTLRLYDLSSFKVLRAVRGLGGEVTSIVCVKRPASEYRDVWLACGRKAFHFKMETSTMIMSSSDALSTLQPLGDEEDVLNELALDSSKKFLAFSADSGNVGVVDLSSMTISMMKTKHENICACVKFIPQRPSELVSGGYDENILHFDFQQRTTLSNLKIPQADSVGGMSFSPPFIMCTAISSCGLFAAGTGDGRLWMGFGGEKKPSSAPKKKTRKWNGLDREEEVLLKVVDGPIVAMAFSEENVLTVSTLLGTLAQFCLERNDKGAGEAKELWRAEAKITEKVNALVVNDTKIVIGGFDKDGKGIIEIWEKQIIPS
ncbi:WD40 repeat-like protein [Dendrothele bispora CBS 962.96]|uniref:WD40 repeat-like protein n=1 Tax=Dendrothele bispora (strain CBS 962.96) TaxID=1314807 RepID=A0A4S8LA30_DENBC|nr:WD40 repeat-like protein [Dendrothele bispora CBS 962.96]